MRTRFIWLGLLATLTVRSGPLHAQPHELEGAWRVTSYVLADGSRHAVDGLIFFTDRDWGVVYFVTDDDGTPRRGAGEGGSYTLEDRQLVFNRRYLVIASSEIGSLPEIPLRMEVRSAADAFVEPCVIDIDGDALSIEFPSGNRMGFRRSTADPPTP